MARNSSQIANQTAAAATISGHLYRASLTAKQMALAAKNAKAMVLRAGDKAAGLKVISNFFDELADKTINLSDTINICAIAISQNSVKQWRAQTFLDRVVRSHHRLQKQFPDWQSENSSRSNGAEQGHSQAKDTSIKSISVCEISNDDHDAPIEENKAAQLRHTIDSTKASLKNQSRNLNQQLSSLRDHLENISHYMQSSSVVAVTFRLEATQTGEFQPLLLHMATTIDDLSNEIKGHVNSSQSQLSQFNL